MYNLLFTFHFSLFTSLSLLPSLFGGGVGGEAGGALGARGCLIIAEAWDGFTVVVGWSASTSVATYLLLTYEGA